MFTGLVQATAEVVRLEHRGPHARLSLAVALPNCALGESIAVSGVCLTVTECTSQGFQAYVSVETLASSTLGSLRPGARVNIERALALGDRLGGHIVAGHVDGVGEVVRLQDERDARRLVVQAPAEIQRFLAAKGSVAIDGVSLTINRLHPRGGFEVMLIPHTLGATTLMALAAGGKVNLEADLLARYVARLLETGSDRSPDEQMLDRLRDGGFI